MKTATQKVGKPAGTYELKTCLVSWNKLKRVLQILLEITIWKSKGKKK